MDDNVSTRMRKNSKVFRMVAIGIFVLTAIISAVDAIWAYEGGEATLKGIQSGVFTIAAILLGK